MDGPQLYLHSTARTYHNMYSRSLAVYVYSTDLCNVFKGRRRRWPRNQNSLTQLNTRNRVTRPKTQQRKLILNGVQCVYRPRHRTQSSLLYTIFSTRILLRVAAAAGCCRVCCFHRGEKPGAKAISSAHLKSDGLCAQKFAFFFCWDSRVLQVWRKGCTAACFVFLISNHNRAHLGWSGPQTGFLFENLF